MNTKELKDKILQLAIQGKLVAQDEYDEPASVILEKIRKEKEQLIKDKIIKKEKSQPDIIEEDKLFDIPTGWEWCRLGNICRFINGDRGKNYPAKKDLIDEGIPFINAGHLINGEISKTNMNYISEEKYESLSSGKVEDKDIIYCLRGTLGKNAIAKDVRKGAIASSLVIIRLVLSKSIDIKFLYYFINSKYELIQRNSYDNGSAQPNLSSDNVKKFVMPVPPIEEQKRIVAKVDSLFKLIDELYSKKQDLLQNISDVRNKVLQLAIQGKLVSQDENDEPASVLLEKIKEEKEQLIKDKVIKKQKTLPQISDDEKLFELPNGWEWCRLSQVSNYIKAGGDKPKDFSSVKSEQYSIPVIANGKTNEGIMGYTNTATENNICITVSGRGTIGYSCIRKEPFCPIVRLIVICPNVNINISYLHYVLQYFIEQGVGTSVQQLTVPMITPKVIPLPPIEEQTRIVAKVEGIMNYLDDLEKQIK